MKKYNDLEEFLQDYYSCKRKQKKNGISRIIKYPSLIVSLMQ